MLSARSTAARAEGESPDATLLGPELIARLPSGVEILAGTDLPVTSQGSRLHEELALLVEAGLSPMAALQAATRNAAEYLDTLDADGTVEPGKLANLVVLEADPLSDIRNSARIYAVVLRGRLLGNSQLQRLRQ